MAFDVKHLMVKYMRFYQITRTRYKYTGVALAFKPHFNSERHINAS